MKRSPTVLLTALCLALLAAFGLMFFTPMPLYAQQSSAGRAIPSALIPSTSIPIYAIQGDGLQSPYAEQWVDTYGLVTGVTDTGFYIQDPFGDDNDDTSDGIFVYTHSRPKVDVGKCVAIERALVDEFYEKTELSRTKPPQPVDWCTGRELTPVPIEAARLAADPVQQYERFEGMLVRIDDLDGVVQGPTKRFNNGDAEIAFVPRAVVPYLPGGRVFQHEPQNMAALMYVGSVLGAELPDLNWGDGLAFGSTGGNDVDGNDADGNDDAVIGVLDYNFGKYQFLPLADQDVVGLPGVPGPDQHPLPPPVDELAGEFTICTFNLLGLGQGSAQNPQPDVYEAQLAKRALAIAERLQGCTIIGLQEAGTPEDAQNLADLLSAEYGLDYTATAIEGPGTQSLEFPLTNALLTRSDRVQVIDAQLRQGCSPFNYDVQYEPGACESGAYGLFNRPPLVVDLMVHGADDRQSAETEPYRLTVIDNHWKSKGGDETINVVRREAQALHVAALVQEVLDAGSGRSANVVVLGDLNDYYGSGPVEALRTTVDPPMVHAYDLLPDLNRYTYIFNGGSQVLDHILVTDSMVEDIAEIRPVRLNANYAYPAAVDAESVQHSSDHDPVLMRMRPGTAAWIGGNVGFGGIDVDLLDEADLLVGSAVSDDDGEFRLWNVSPGKYRIRLTGPDTIRFDEDEWVVEVQPGGNRIDDVRAEHAVVDLGAAAALNAFRLAAP